MDKAGASLPVAESWFTAEHVDDGIVMLTEPHVARLWRANIFLIRGRDYDLLVDSGMGVASLRKQVTSLTDRPIKLFTTHSHLDHIGGHHEFADIPILVHPAEQAALLHPAGPTGLSYESLPKERLAQYQAAGFDTTGLMVDALPTPGYDLDSHTFAGATATRLVEDGALLDLGQRLFEVLHLPGHSPGSIGLWEAATGTLIAGDAIYDGILIDTTQDADINAYLGTMERLRGLPVRVVHGGHKRPFGRDRMLEIIDAYLASRRDGRSPRPDGVPASF